MIFKCGHGHYAGYGDDCDDCIKKKRELLKKLNEGRTCGRPKTKTPQEIRRRKAEWHRKNPRHEYHRSRMREKTGAVIGSYVVKNGLTYLVRASDRPRGLWSDDFNRAYVYTSERRALKACGQFGGEAIDLNQNIKLENSIKSKPCFVVKLPDGWRSCKRTVKAFFLAKRYSSYKHAYQSVKMTGAGIVMKRFETESMTLRNNKEGVSE